ncbi:MAG: hypothetical protein KKH67_08460 [candidate division Zixibacteria bacterium]|nr:hypothetical protein [candidate division Zixibacteria bacterium]
MKRSMWLMIVLWAFECIMFINSDRVDLRAEVFSPSATTADNYDFRRFAEQVLLIFEGSEVSSSEDSREISEIFQDQISKLEAIYAAEALCDTLLQRYPDGPVQDTIITYSIDLEKHKRTIEYISLLMAVTQLYMVETLGSAVCETMTAVWQAEIDAGLDSSTHAGSSVWALADNLMERNDLAEPIEEVGSLLAVIQQSCNGKSCEACSNLAFVLKRVKRIVELAFRPEGTYHNYVMVTLELKFDVYSQLAEFELNMTQILK